MKYFFISDSHFGHFNIVKYCSRPFTSLKEMDETIIKNINSRVQENDVLIHLGDFTFNQSSEASDAPKKAFNYYREQIKCKNIIICNGSHDSNNGARSIIEGMEIKIGGKRIWCCHDPKDARSEYELNFCGHKHNAYKFLALTPKSTIVNLSVEMWDYTPVEINQILEAYYKWKNITK